jgi:hypothetical protein
MSSQPFWVDGVFWGIVGLIGTAITIIFEMRKSRGMFNNILEFLSGSTQSGVDDVNDIQLCNDSIRMEEYEY